MSVKKIQILGTGCPKCRQLAENAVAAVQQTGAACEVVKITDLNEIAGFGVMFTPALAVDGKVKAAGKVLSPEAIAALIAE